MPNAKKIGDQWSVLAYLGKDENGKKVYKRVSGYNKTKVEHEASGLSLEYKNTNKKTKKDVLTTGAVIDNYIESKSNIMSPSTLRAYKSIRKHHFGEIEDMYATDLSGPVLQSFVNKKAMRLSPKTVRNIFGLLVAALNEYYPDTVPKVHMPQKIKTNIQIPSDDIVRAYLSATEGTELHKAISLAAFLGLRRSEICGLTRQDIDFKQKTLTVNKAVVVGPDNAEVLKPPKTEAGYRIIVVPDFILKKFEGIKEKAVDLTVHQITDGFIALNKKLGYHYRFHDLRHYNASVMLMLGVPDKYAQERIGHATDDMLKNVYQHTINKKQVEIANIMNSYFSAEFEKDNKIGQQNADKP